MVIYEELTRGLKLQYTHIYIYNLHFVEKAVYTLSFNITVRYNWIVISMLYLRLFNLQCYVYSLMHLLTGWTRPKV